ncbi:MAG: hypothetical protein ACK4E4_02135 [Rhodocyclaceae bacterium]
MKIWLRLIVGIWLILAIVWTGMILWQSQVTRTMAIEQANRFAHSMHEATLAGLTGMMITGTIGQREVFLDQIRKLAEKSAASANEIDGITRTLSSQSELVRTAIEEGLANISSSERSLTAVVDAINESDMSVEQVGLGLDQIAAATEEQRQVSTKVLADVEAIATMARENSKAIEQNAMAAQRLEALANELQGTVSRFRT